MSAFTYPPFMTYVTVTDAPRAIEFYTAAFGARERYRLADQTSGVIGHAELDLNGGVLMLSEENPQWGTKSPATLGGSPAKFCLMVENADTAIDKAVAAGATLTMPPTDMFYGFRNGCVRDPFGFEWMIQHEIESVSPSEMQKRWNAMLAEGCPPPE
jgi:uncharacterized glyoxalase superfamily protein PhnB